MYAKLLSILLLITIVVISGCTSQNNSGTTLKSLTEHLTAQRISELNGFCEKSISPEKCKILVSGNTNSCETLEETDRSDCFREFAVLSENPALCEKIDDEQISDRCNGELFSLLKDPITLAVSSGDISKCDSYYDPSLCYMEVAHALKDSSICEKVSLLKQTCLAVASENPNLCIGADCLNKVNKKIALTRKDISYCDKISETSFGSEINDCYKDVILSTKDLSLCELPRSPLTKSHCYSILAEELKNPSLCDRISSIADTLVKTCYFDAVVASLKPSEVAGEKQECARKNPDIKIEPSAQEIPAGNTATYSVTATNNDNVQCGASNFEISELWSATAISDITYEFGEQKMQPISPGNTLTFDVHVLTNSRAPSGSYSFSISAKNDNAEFYSNKVQATVSLK